MFENFKIRRLQCKVVNREEYNNDIKKSIEELKELLQELELFKFKYEPYRITREDLRHETGNMLKEIRDGKNIIDKLEKLFVRTSQQRRVYKECGKRVIYQLTQYLYRG